MLDVSGGMRDEGWGELHALCAFYELVSIRRIWDGAPNNAFTDLIRFREHWFCVFREAGTHLTSDGSIRVLTSEDGTTWNSAARITSADADLRDPKIASSPGGQLVLSAAAAFHNPGTVTHQTKVWTSKN